MVVLISVVLLGRWRALKDGGRWSSTMEERNEVERKKEDQEVEETRIGRGRRRRRRRREKAVEKRRRRRRRLERVTSTP